MVLAVHLRSDMLTSSLIIENKLIKVLQVLDYMISMNQHQTYLERGRESYLTSVTLNNNIVCIFIVYKLHRFPPKVCSLTQIY